jgi:hypothetical protein
MEEEIKDADIEQSSPLPEEEPETMSFYDALDKALTGKRMRRQQWPEGEYGYFEGDFLNIFKNGEKHRWILSKGDVIESDYEVF